MNSQLRDASAHWLDIAGIPLREPLNPDLDARPCAKIV
jgi:hypothetical protein